MAYGAGFGSPRSIMPSSKGGMMENDVLVDASEKVAGAASLIEACAMAIHRGWEPSREALMIVADALRDAHGKIEEAALEK